MADSDVSIVKRRTATSILWSLLGRGSTTATSFLIFLLLARLLTPAEFGLFALAQVFVDVTRIIATSGWTDAVVRTKVLDDETLDTAFWANLGLGMLVALVAVAVAGPYAALTHQPVVEPLLWWLAPLVPISCLGSIHIGQALHGFGYRALAARAFVSNLLAGGAAVAAALAGWGVWSLVVQALVADVTLVVFAWISFRWMPGRRFSARRFRELFGFTATMMVTQLLWLLLVRVPDLFIARSLGPAALGAYRIGFRMFELIGQLVLQPVAAVALTTFSRMQGEGVPVEGAYVRIVGLLGLGIFPIMGGFGVLAPELIPMAFGDRWQASVPVAQILMGLMIPYLLSYFDGPIFGAAGRPRSLTMIAGAQVSLTLALSWLVAPYGLAAIAAAYVLRSFLTLPLQQYLMNRAAGVRASRVWRAIAKPFLAAAGMVIGTALLRGALMPHVPSPELRVLLLVPAGAMLYASLLLLLARHEIVEHYGFVRSLLPSRRKAV